MQPIARGQQYAFGPTRVSCIKLQLACVTMRPQTIPITSERRSRKLRTRNTHLLQLLQQLTALEQQKNPLPIKGACQGFNFKKAGAAILAVPFPKECFALQDSHDRSEER